MVGWNPKDHMGFWRYLKFKRGKWVKVDSIPEWVFEANNGYYQGYIDKYGERPYGVEKVYRGNSLEYKIQYKTVTQGEVEEI